MKESRVQRRIALMIDSSAPGGAERMVLQLGEALRERGHGIVPVGPDRPRNWLRDEFRARGFEPELYPVMRPLDPRRVGALVRILRRRGVDVVHSHEFTMAVFGAAAARILGVPHVVTLHGGVAHITARLRRRVVLRWALRASRPVAVSRAARDELVAALGLPAAAVGVVHNGIRFRRGSGSAVRTELGLADDEPLILAVGNLYPVKGHVHLLRAAARLRERRPELRWRLAIAGKVTLHGRVEEEAAEFLDFAAAHGFADRFHLLGFRDDVPDLLDAADVYAMPSLSEGLPLALLEAMFAGKPVVVSRVGGVPEVIRTPDEGVLVAPAHPDELSRELERLLDDSALRAALGAAARQRSATAFDAQVMVAAYEDLYGVPGPALDPSAAAAASGPPACPPAPTQPRPRRPSMQKGMADE